LEIETGNNLLKDDIVNLLKKIHVPGKVLDKSIIVYGYKKDNEVKYIE